MKPPPRREALDFPLTRRRFGGTALRAGAGAAGTALFGGGSLALALGLPASAAAQGTGGALKVLRTSFPVAETGFDPAQISDLYSRTITAHIFEGLYHYDHLARPSKIKPLTAAAMPEVSDDFRTWTLRVRPGIHFADDPAFKGQRRELTAADFAYALKRFADPALKSPAWGGVEEVRFTGLAALRKAALDGKQAFDYDRPIEGVQALDRYTLRLRTDEPRPRLLESLTGGLVDGVAREVVEFYGERISEHPVGTGPFKLGAWRRSSQIVLERNPGFREMRFDAEPAADDAEGQALLEKYKGRRLPLIDRVEVSIIEEQQPRWLAFLNGQIDYVAVPGEFVNQAMPGGEVAPNLAKQGIRAYRVLQPDTAITYFNWESPVVGGNAPHRIALRRAISLGIDVEREIRLVRRGQAIPAQGPIPPHTTGYDPAFKSENGDYDPARAKALLDVYGYIDSNKDGWREQPDGSPLVLEIATQPDQISRQFDELWKRNMDALGIRTAFGAAQWPEQLKQARAGKLMIWVLGSTAGSPDGQGSLARMHGPQAGGQNLARFRLPEMDALYERLSGLPDGPEREKLFFEAKRLAVAYMPYKTHVHRIATDMVHPWIDNYRRPVFWQDTWQYMDVDMARRAQR
jgi:ABC-type transport system substrate-binding protein